MNIWAVSWEKWRWCHTFCDPSNARTQPLRAEGPEIWPFVWGFFYFLMLHEWTTKALARLLGCAGSPESTLVAYMINTLFTWAGSFEPRHDKTNKMACLPSKDSDQPGNPPSLISVFAVRMTKAWVLSYPLSAPQRLWSDWADAQTDLNFCCARSHFVGFVMRRLIWGFDIKTLMVVNSVSSQCAHDKSSIVWKPEDHPKIFKW